MVVDEGKLIDLLAEQLPPWLSGEDYAKARQAITDAVAAGLYAEHGGFVEVAVVSGWSGYVRAELVESS